MILDGRSEDAARVETYDVLIIGAGPAGITLALELHGQGLRIGLLESGGEGFDPDTQMLYDGAVTGHTEAVDLAAIRLRYLGGTTNHWAGRCLPMDRIDFERAPLSGLSGWPISYDDMLPFYERAADYLEIGRLAYDPMEIGDITFNDLLLPGAEALRTVVIRQSHVQFGPAYKDDLAQSRDIQLWLWTNLVGIETDSNGTATAVETRTFNGFQRRFTAPFIILACGAVENARQLILHNARSGQQFGDAGNFLGRCYMDHPAGGGAFLWLNATLPPSLYWDRPSDNDGTLVNLLWALSEETMARERLANIQFYLTPADENTDPRIREANRGWRSLRNIAKLAIGQEVGQGGSPVTLSSAYCQVINNADMMTLDALGLIDRNASTQRLFLRYEAEQLPDRASYVSLSGAHDALGQPRADLHWSPSEADRDSIMRSITLIGQAAGTAGFGRIELTENFNEPYWNTNTSWHQMGTTRMAIEPRNGVVDPDCRVHGSRNLYVAGGSVMPTGGRANPTMTIVALSIRLADHLKRRLST